jgi:hypothetical protein
MQLITMAEERISDLKDRFKDITQNVIQSKKVVIKKGGWSFLECLGED